MLRQEEKIERERDKSSTVREIPPGGVRRCRNHHRPHVQGHDSSHDGTGYHQIRTNKDKDKDVMCVLILVVWGMLHPILGSAGRHVKTSVHCLAFALAIYRT